MISIVDGCQSPSDVLSKKSDFYYFLKSNGIIESKQIDYYTQENHEFNIMDTETIQSISDELEVNVTENLKFLNFVSIRRKEKFSDSFENIGHILLTGNSTTIKVALHEKVKPDEAVPLATSLNWITNRFWFKLNKGFGDGKFPTTFDVIAKAQIVLSSVLNRSIGEKYDELQAEFKQGKMTDEMAMSRVIELRSQVRKPEEIGLDDISPILDVLSEDSLEKFAKEQEFSKNEAIKQSQENIRLKKELTRKEEAFAKEKAALIKTQSELIYAREKNLGDNKEIVEKLENNRKQIDKLAQKDLNSFKLKLAVTAAFLFAIPCFLTWRFGIDVMSIISWLSPFFLLVYLFIFEKEWKWKPVLFLEKKKEQYQTKRYLEFQFDINHLNRLKDEIKSLEDEIENLRAEHHLE